MDDRYVSGSPDHAWGWRTALPSDPPLEEKVHVAGTRIEFFHDDTVTIPLWDEDGLLPGDPEWLARELRLSRELVAALAAWSIDEDGPTSEDPAQVAAWLERTPERAAEAARLFDCLQAEILPGFTVARPW